MPRMSKYREAAEAAIAARKHEEAARAALERFEREDLEQTETAIREAEAQLSRSKTADEARDGAMALANAKAARDGLVHYHKRLKRDVEAATAGTVSAHEHIVYSLNDMRRSAREVERLERAIPGLEKDAAEAARRVESARQGLRNARAQASQTITPEEWSHIAGGDGSGNVAIRWTQNGAANYSAHPWSRQRIRATDAAAHVRSGCAVPEDLLPPEEATA